VWSPSSPFIPHRTRRRQPASATVQSFCFTFNQRLVAPPSYTLRSSLGHVPLVPALDHLLPRVQASDASRRTGKTSSLPVTTSSSRARRSRSGRRVRSRRSWYSRSKAMSRGGEATASVGAFGHVGCYEPVVGNPDSRDSFKQMPVAGHAFEWSPATILEADTGTGNEIPDGA
jgi:hypothetical protein